MVGKNNETVQELPKVKKPVKKTKKTKSLMMSTGHSGQFTFSSSTEDHLSKEEQSKAKWDIAESQQLVKGNIDSSLTNLFKCMSLAYSGRLTSPRFKAFKGMRKVSLKDKVRLNNIIWREWHVQYIKKKKPLVCQFCPPFQDDTHHKPEAVVLEGKYWKRRLETVSLEYKKWRVFFKEELARENQDKELEEVISHSELLERVTQQDVHKITQHTTELQNMLIPNDDFTMDLSDTLFSSLNQPFPFPSFNTRELSQLGHVDYLQPGLIQLQPTLDDFMDTIETDSTTDPVLIEWDGNTDFLSSVSGGTQHPNDVLLSEITNGVPSNSNQQEYYTTQSFNSYNTNPIIVTPATYSSDHNQSVTVLNLSNQITNVPVNQNSTVYVDNEGSNSTNYNGSVMSLLQNTGNGKSTSATSTVSKTTSHAKSSTAKKQEFLVPKGKPGRKPRNIAPATVGQVKVVTSASSVDSNSTQRNTYLGQLLSSPMFFGMKPTSEESSSKYQKIRPAVTSIVSTPLTTNLTTLAHTATLGMSDLSNSSTLILPVNTTTSASTTTNIIATTTLPTEVTTFSSVLPSYALDSSNLLNPASPPNTTGKPKGKAQYREHRRASHISAEQKRRCNIKSGFDMLYVLIPSLIQNPNAKVSKAAMLQKTADFCCKLKQERAQMQEEADILKTEIEALNTSISNCQMQLPATGAPVTRQRADQMKEMFDDYVRSRTQGNWKFYIFSIIIRGLFDSFNNMVSTASMDELCRTVLAWLDQHCSLVSLRPAVLNALRQLSTSTSILSNPNKLSEEALEAVQKRDPPHS